MSKRDYVVQTHPCAEVLARANLEAEGFAVFLPTVVYEGRTGPLRQKRYTTIEPLFPGYLFVTVDLTVDPWREITKQRGVRCILGQDVEHPKALPPGVLAELQQRYAAGEFVKRGQVNEIRAGDRVLVASGPFAGHSGTCTDSRRDRIKVMLSKLWGAVEVEMSPVMVAVNA